FLLLGGQRGLETELAHLLLEAEAVIAHHGAEDHRTAAELRRTQRTLASTAGALLRPGLLGRAGDFADLLGLVRAGPALGELPVDDAREDIAPHHRQPEDFVGEIDIAGLFVLEAGDFQLHLRPPPAPVALPAVPPGTADPWAPDALPHPSPARRSRRNREPRRPRRSGRARHRKRGFSNSAS